MTVSRAKGAKAKADTLFSQLIRSRGRCERCGSTTYLQTAHVHSRRFSATRVDPLNAWCACASCHFAVDTHADEKMALVDQTIGRGEYDRLKTKALTVTKMDWSAEVARLKALLEAVAA